MLFGPDSGFNGATSARSWNCDPANAGAGGYFALQWGHERALVELSLTSSSVLRYSSFNGATSARSWNWLRTLNALPKLRLLQWGHERALVEFQNPPSKPVH